MTEELKIAIEEIVKALRNNAAPYEVSYALTQVDNVQLSSDLLHDLCVAYKSFKEQK